MPTVYATQDDCNSDLGKLMQYWRALRPDEWTIDEFIREAEKMHTEILKLKDVAFAMQEWIDSVPDHVRLPAMPGYDREWANEVLRRYK